MIRVCVKSRSIVAKWIHIDMPYWQTNESLACSISLRWSVRNRYAGGMEPWQSRRGVIVGDGGKSVVLGLDCLGFKVGKDAGNPFFWWDPLSRILASSFILTLFQECFAWFRLTYRFNKKMLYRSQLDWIILHILRQKNVWASTTAWWSLVGSLGCSVWEKWQR